MSWNWICVKSWDFTRKNTRTFSSLECLELGDSCVPGIRIPHLGSQVLSLTGGEKRGPLSRNWKSARSFEGRRQASEYALRYQWTEIDGVTRAPRRTPSVRHHIPEFTLAQNALLVVVVRREVGILEMWFCATSEEGREDRHWFSIRYQTKLGASILMRKSWRNDSLCKTCVSVYEK